MSKYKKGKSSSTKSEEEAKKIAQGIQKSGQTKEQTKIISQGIQKGIELYKKQQNAKNREIDKSRKQARKEKNTSTKEENTTNVIQYKQHWLPWALLALTWVGIVTYFSIPFFK